MSGNLFCNVKSTSYGIDTVLSSIDTDKCRKDAMLAIQRHYDPYIAACEFADCRVGKAKFFCGKISSLPSAQISPVEIY